MQCPWSYPDSPLRTKRAAFVACAVIAGWKAWRPKALVAYTVFAGSKLLRSPPLPSSCSTRSTASQKLTNFGRPPTNQRYYHHAWFQRVVENVRRGGGARHFENRLPTSQSAFVDQSFTPSPVYSSRYLFRPFFQASQLQSRQCKRRLGNSFTDVGEHRSLYVPISHSADRVCFLLQPKELLFPLSSMHHVAIQLYQHLHSPS